MNKKKKNKKEKRVQSEQVYEPLRCTYMSQMGTLLESTHIRGQGASAQHTLDPIE
jgi:hypothetical protein